MVLPGSLRADAMKSLAPSHVLSRFKGLEGKVVAVYVAYSHRGALEPLVAYQLSALRRAGLLSCLVLTSDQFQSQSYDDIAAHTDSLILRANLGHEFGAWADAFRLFPELWQAERLLLLDDSILGPGRGFTDFLEGTFRIDADMVGLVEIGGARAYLPRHFLLLNRNLLSSAGFQGMWGAIQNLQRKRDVTEAYEMQLTSKVRQLGFTASAIFTLPKERSGFSDPLTSNWKWLLEHGSPYVKANAVRWLLSAKAREWLKFALQDAELSALVDEI